MAEETHRRPKITRRAFLQATVESTLGLAGLAIVGTGCSSSPTPAPTSAPAAKAAAPVATAQAPAAVAAPTVAKARQDIVVGIGSDVTIMDGRIQQADQSRSQITHVVEPLLWPDNDGKPVGILTSSWEPSTDPTGWRFRLRPNIKYSNGEPFNAQSVKYTLESVLDSANNDWVVPGVRSGLDKVQGVKVEDDLTVMILTKGYHRTLPIGLYQYPIVPAKYGAEKGKEFGINPIGTGHYKFVEYKSKDHLRLEVNPDYHGNWDGPAKNDSVTFRYLSENATRTAALESGEIHLAYSLPPDAVSRIKSNPNLDVLMSPTNRINGMFFHCGRAPFNNLKARLAVVHAIDKQGIVQKIMGGMGAVATAPFPPGTVGTAGETFQPFPYDTKLAKQYFDEAGLTNGTKIKVGGTTGSKINDVQIVTAVASMLSDVGFDPQVEQLDFSVLWPKATQGYYDMFYMGWAAAGYDPDDLRQIYLGSGDDNAGLTHFVEYNKQIQDLYDKANQTPSQQEAESYLRQLSHLLWDSQPVAFMSYEPNIVGISKKLKGWQPRRDTYIYMWGAYLG